MTVKSAVESNHCILSKGLFRLASQKLDELNSLEACFSLVKCLFNT